MQRFQICVPTPERFVRPLQIARNHFHFKMLSNTLFLEIKTKHDEVIKVRICDGDLLPWR